MLSDAQEVCPLYVLACMLTSIYTHDTALTHNAAGCSKHPHKLKEMQGSCYCRLYFTLLKDGTAYMCSGY